jgi:hypothetical protein
MTAAAGEVLLADVALAVPVAKPFSYSIPLASWTAYPRG